MSRDNAGIDYLYIIEARGSDPADQWGYYHDSITRSQREAREYIRDKRRTTWANERYRIVRFDRARTLP